MCSLHLFAFLIKLYICEEILSTEGVSYAILVNIYVEMLSFTDFCN